MSLTDLWIDVTLRLQQLTWVDWLDLLLVTGTLFLLLTALQRAQATVMLRGLGVIGLILLVSTLFLGLPTFSLLVRVILVFLLVALPVVFQRQLRILFEDVGRSIGVTDRSRRRKTEALMQPLVRALEQMAAEQIGALIVLEGEVDLDEIADTGVAVDGAVTSELLKAIFYSKNPLHDGAVLIRGERVVAAACVLPVARGLINGDRSLGTRHRAAVGMSQRSDALIVVVSEETGTISVAEGGQLETLPDQSALRERLLRFARQGNPVRSQDLSMRFLFDADTGALRPSFVRRARRFILRFGMALLLAVSLWWVVLTSSGSLPDTEVGGVQLQVEEPADGLVIAAGLPETVDLIVRTAQEPQATLGEEAFKASLSLADLPAGVHQLPVAVTSRLEAPVQIVDVQPETVEVNLAPLQRRTLPVTVALRDEALLPATYEVRSEATVDPGEVEVVGPQPLVERVATIRATLSLSNTRGPVETMRPLVALDDQGNEVNNITLRPDEVEVHLNVGRRADMREVGIAVVTSGQPAPGFWISGLSTDPGTVVLSGSPELLSAMDSAVATLPVDVEGAAGAVTADMPLDVPDGVSVQARDGQSLNRVQVNVLVSPHSGNLTVTRPVELPAGANAVGITVRPQVVEVLLSGPLPTLQEIEERPDLVRVVVASVEVASGESVEQVPDVIVPEGVRAQLVTRQVTLSRP